MNSWVNRPGPGLHEFKVFAPLHGLKFQHSSKGSKWVTFCLESKHAKWLCDWLAKIQEESRGIRNVKVLKQKHEIASWIRLFQPECREEVWICKQFCTSKTDKPLLWIYVCSSSFFHPWRFKEALTGCALTAATQRAPLLPPTHLRLQRWQEGRGLHCSY